MIQTSTRIALEAIVGVLAVLALLIGLAFWRLSAGPVQLDFLTPQMEQALSDPDSGLTVRIGTTQLTWGGWRRTVDLHARKVKVRDAQGAVIASLPDVVVRLSLRALVQGTVAPTVVEIIGARLNLVRREDGTFQFGPWDRQGVGAAGEADFSRVLPSVIEELLSKPAAGEPLSFLKAVRIVGGRVSVNDRKLSFVWEAPYADILLRRDAGGLAGETDLVIQLGETRAKVFAGFLYDRTTNRIDLDANFADLLLQAIVPVAPQLAALGGLSVPLDGSLSASVAVDGAVDALRFNVSGGSGELALPDLLAAPLPVREVRAAGRISGPDRRLDIEAATVALGSASAPGPEITVTGVLTSSGDDFAGDWEIEVALTASGVAMADLGRYWPEGVGGNERAWVLANVPKGTIERVAVHAALRVPGGEFGNTELSALDGAIDYAGLEVHFLRPMPPVVGVSGTGRFDGSTITFTPERGRNGLLEIQPSTVAITGLDTPDQMMVIDLAVIGPLREMLELLDHDRLRLIRQLGLDPSVVRGDMAARAEFRFPLIAALTLDDIEIAARANTERVALDRFLLGLDASEGSLSLEVDKSGMQIEGPVRLGGVPLELVWVEAFTPDVRQRRRLEVQAQRLHEAGRKAFGLDLAPYLEGAVSAYVVATTDRDGGGTVTAAVNLREAKLAFAPLSWDKPAGVEGAAYLKLGLAGERLTDLSSLDIAAGTLRARGKGTFDASGRRLASLTLSDLAFGASSLSDVAVDLAREGVGVRVGGGVLDATPWLGDGAADGSEAPEREKERADEETTPDAPEVAEVLYTPLSLSATGLDAVYFGPDRYLEQLDLDLVRSPRGWERIRLVGRVPRSLWYAGREAPGADAPGAEAKTLKFDFGPKEGGGKRLLVTAEDMGAVLRALDALDTVNGGRLEITGDSDGPLPGAPLRARIEAHDYVLVDAPTLARLLTVASLTGINDLLKGQGIRFRRLVGEFTLQDGKLRTDLIRAYGPALGLTAKGEIDFDRSLTDLRGTIVPAYTVNRILGEIPLLGPLLTGGEGQGLIAITYRMTGPLGDPDVSVNPLSALAPGFLRALFSAGSGDAERPRAMPERQEP